MDKIIQFQNKPQPVQKPAAEVKKPLQIDQVAMFGLLTVDDRDLWIDDPASIMKIMKFIIAEKIKITEGRKNPPRFPPED